MINKEESLTAEWIDKVSKANRKADKILIEKVIRVLLLLEGLSNSGLSFIFKGGSCKSPVFVNFGIHYGISYYILIFLPLFAMPIKILLLI